MKRAALHFFATTMMVVLAACGVGTDPDIETKDLPRGKVGVWYDFTLTATNDGENWSIAEGSLPPDLTMNEPDGRIWGYPLSAGTYPLRICNWKQSNLALECEDFTLVIDPL